MHDRHDAERARLGSIQFGPSSSLFPMPGHAALEAEWQHHHETCCYILSKAQHRTVQDYARWRLKWWFKRPWPEVSEAELEALGCAADADALIARLKARCQEEENTRKRSMPVRQLEGTDAFSGAGVTSWWRHYTGEELWPSGECLSNGCNVLVTTDRRPHIWHVCFSHDPKHPGVSITNSFERVATAFLREAQAEATLAGFWHRGGRADVRGWLPHWLRPGQPRPRQLRFYEHYPPTDSMRETLDQVRLTYRNGRFHGPRWTTLPVIPAALAQARHEVPRVAGVMTYSAEQIVAVPAFRR